MNSLPGLLIEYFINGAIALLWIIRSFFPEWVPAENSMLFVLIPIIYVLDMMIDVLAYAITYFPKHIIRKTYINGETEKLKWTDKQLNVLIAAKYHELLKEIDNRSSRDRICRGMIINSICIALFLPAFNNFFGIGLIIISTIMWIIFEKQSHKYFKNVREVIGSLES